MVNLTVLPLQLPFKSKFGHARFVRAESESFFVKAELNGFVGFGESCPRSYVTSESFKSCNQFLEQNKGNISALTNLDELNDWVTRNRKLIEQSPAAWCAIEISLLDLFARIQNTTVSNLLGLNNHYTIPKFSAIVGSENVKKSLLFRLMGFSDFKLKVAGDLNLSQRQLRLIELMRVGPENIRLDANNYWQNYQTCLAELEFARDRIWAIEEPLKAFDFNGMVALAKALNCKVILDESFLTLHQMPVVLKHSELFVINVRVSKLGGVLRTIEILESIKQHDLMCIFGSHVGETSLLGAVQYSLATHYAKAITHIEGGFSTWLLTRDPFQPQLKLGYSGKYPAIKLSDLGWGVDYVA